MMSTRSFSANTDCAVSSLLTAGYSGSRKSTRISARAMHSGAASRNLKVTNMPVPPHRILCGTGMFNYSARNFSRRFRPSLILSRLVA